jgi:hypothetical protein
MVLARGMFIHEAMSGANDLVSRVRLIPNLRYEAYHIRYLFALPDFLPVPWGREAPVGMTIRSGYRLSGAKKVQRYFVGMPSLCEGLCFLRMTA